jgi:cysteine desulfurase
MTRPSVYLDYNATAPLRPEVISVMHHLMALPLNASSVHSAGREAKKQLENARNIIADCISAWPNEVVFCGSGTEANNWALHAVGGRKIVVSAIEHSSVLKGATGKEQRIAVDSHGVVELAALNTLLAAGEPALVSVMLANNETGVIQPIAEVSEICKKYGALLHCDAVQGVGKIPVDFGALGADMMTISAHKCGGPLGAAALIVRRDLAIQPLLTGGGQELGRRAGTENIAAIIGFAKAVELIDLGHMQLLRGWLQSLENAGGVVFGTSVPRLPNTTCIAMSGVSSEVQLMNFDLKGFAVSAGSACSSGRVESSHVLDAMGAGQWAQNAIRVSGGWGTLQYNIEAFTKEWQNTYKRLVKPVE